jgi:hypothetical protein
MLLPSWGTHHGIPAKAGSRLTVAIVEIKRFFGNGRLFVGQ